LQGIGDAAEHFSISATEAISNGAIDARPGFNQVDLCQGFSVPANHVDFGSADYHTDTALGHCCSAVDLFMGKLSNLLLRFLCDSTLRGFPLPFQWPV
jgi:hypothetical protein